MTDAGKKRYSNKFDRIKKTAIRFLEKIGTHLLTEEDNELFRRGRQITNNQIWFDEINRQMTRNAINQHQMHVHQMQVHQMSFNNF